MEVNHYCLGKQTGSDHSVQAEATQQSSEQEPLLNPNVIYIDANVGNDKTPMSAIFDSGSNCNVMSRRYYTSNVGNVHLLREPEQSVTSFNGVRSSIIGLLETDVSFVGNSVPMPFKVIDRIKYDAMLGLDFIEKNVKSIDVKQRKLTLACGTVVPFREGDPAFSKASSNNFEPVVVNTLRVSPQWR